MSTKDAYIQDEGEKYPDWDGRQASGMIEYDSGGNVPLISHETCREELNLDFCESPPNAILNSNGRAGLERQDL